jgi:hypothetical protein
MGMLMDMQHGLPLEAGGSSLSRHLLPMVAAMQQLLQLLQAKQSCHPSHHA